MQTRALGRGGPSVSVLGIGTVSLGIDYGIAQPGNSGRPAEADAIATLRHAHALGFSFYDTAPAYGAAEEILGRALGDEPSAILATKVTVPAQGDLRGAIDASIAESQRRLGRACLPLVQIHNATVPLLERGELTRILVEHRDRGHIAALGASVYTEDEALCAIDTGVFGAIQVGFSALDRRMARRVFPHAIARGVGVIVRSIYLKGVLTEKGAHLPPSLSSLERATDEMCRAANVSRAALPRLALAYGLSEPAVSTIIVGVRTQQEVDVAHAALAHGPLDAATKARIEAIAVEDERLLNPATWPAL